MCVLCHPVLHVDSHMHDFKHAPTSTLLYAQIFQLLRQPNLVCQLPACLPEQKSPRSLTPSAEYAGCRQSYIFLIYGCFHHIYYVNFHLRSLCPGMSPHSTRMTAVELVYNRCIDKETPFVNIDVESESPDHHMYHMRACTP